MALQQQQQQHAHLLALVALLGVAAGAVGATAAMAVGSAASASHGGTGGESWLARLRRLLLPGGGRRPSDPFEGITREEMEAVRARHMFSKLTLFYADEENDESSGSSTSGGGPLCLVRGEGAYVYDAEGRQILDCVNNVAHIGHSHPALRAAAMRQLSEINTNTRYHHPGRSRYAKKLLALFPPELDTVFFVNSGSEANDLALALAQAYTRREDVVVLDAAYHGHTTTMMDMSAYKHTHRNNDDDNGGASSSSTDGFPKPWVHVVATPDTYRGKHTGPDAGVRYAEEVAKAVTASATGVRKAQQGGKRGVAAFFAEGVLACGGQVVLPPGYLQAVYAIVHQAGGLCVADEVQTGFGRSGAAFWAHETQGVTPDIVTLGKPIANGFPLAAIVTRKEIAESLPHSYFNTYGGNNLAMAMGEATLDVVLKEGLQAKAHALGQHLHARFQSELMAKHEVVGDVRGLGMMLGVELVSDRARKTPAPEAAAYVLRRARDLGVHIQVDGLFENVLKFKPPLAFSMRDADTLVATVDRALTEWAEITARRQEQQQQQEKKKGGKASSSATSKAAAFDPPHLPVLHSK